MKATEIKKEEFFSDRNKEYKIEEGILVKVKRPLFSRRKPVLVRFGEMSYYRLSGGDYILHHSSLYPCFDEYDRRYENRYFHVYYFCRSLVEVKEKYDYLTSGKIFFSNLHVAEKYRQPLYPYVYYDDGKDHFWVYE